MTASIPPPVCPYCTKPAFLIKGPDLYPNRKSAELQSKWFWRCDPCRATVGCHGTSFRPLGMLANRELRQWRQKAHRAFDPLWKYPTHNLSRSHLRSLEYKWLASRLGIARQLCHLALFDLTMCKAVVKVCEERKKLEPRIPVVDL